MNIGKDKASQIVNVDPYQKFLVPSINQNSRDDEFYFIVDHSEATRTMHKNFSDRYLPLVKGTQKLHIPHKLLSKDCVFGTDYYQNGVNRTENHLPKIGLNQMCNHLNTLNNTCISSKGLAVPTSGCKC